MEPIRCSERRLPSRGPQNRNRRYCWRFQAIQVLLPPFLLLLRLRLSFIFKRYVVQYYQYKILKNIYTNQ